MRFDAIIFDFDGTLADSMSFWDSLTETWLRKRGLPALPGLLDALVHMTATESAEHIRAAYRLSDPPEALLDEWSRTASAAFATGIRLKPGALSFLRRLHERGIRMGIATSCLPAAVEALLGRYGIRHYFDTVVYTDEFERGKAFPDVYEAVAQRLAVDPARCVVFEDILPALEGVRAAGMAFVGVEDARALPDREAIRASADLYITDYRDVAELEQFLGLSDR